MGKIPVSALIADFRRMARENWTYGTDTRQGTVDCSGAFVWAYEQHGHDIYHGSNRMARVEVGKLIPIDQAVIVPGMAAFKHRKPGAEYYDLPDDYQEDGDYYTGDLSDYYHVGLVDEDTSRVLNAQNEQTGFVSSPITQGWTHVGYLTQVDYGDKKEDVPMSEITTATVWAASGSTVNLRSKPDGDLIDRVPVGATVTVSGHQDGWSRIAYNGLTGWMMDKYLSVGGNPAPSAAPSNDTVSITLPRAAAEQLRDSLGNALGWG